MGAPVDTHTAAGITDTEFSTIPNPIQIGIDVPITRSRRAATGDHGNPFLQPALATIGRGTALSRLDSELEQDESRDDCISRPARTTHFPGLHLRLTMGRFPNSLKSFRVRLNGCRGPGSGPYHTQ